MILVLRNIYRPKEKKNKFVFHLTYEACSDVKSTQRNEKKNVIESQSQWILPQEEYRKELKKEETHIKCQIKCANDNQKKRNKSKKG